MKISYTIQTVVFVLITFLTHAQPAHSGKWYARVAAGYGFPLMSQTTFLNGVPINGTDQISVGSPGSGGQATESVTLKRASFGAGAVACVAAGYMISPHIGVELGVQSIVLPTSYSFTADYTGSLQATEEYTTKAQPSLSILPSVVVTSSGKNLRVYGRGGLVIPVADKIVIQSSVIANSQVDNYWEYLLSHSFSVGFQGAVGLNYPLSPGVSIGTELAGTFRNAYTRRLEVTRYERGGTDMLGSLTVRDKVTEYDFSASSASGGQDTPQKDLTSVTPYSSIGVNVGLRFNF